MTRRLFLDFQFKGRMARDAYWKIFAVRAGIILVCFLLAAQATMGGESGAGMGGQMYPGPDGQMYPAPDGQMYPAPDGQIYPGTADEMGGEMGDDALLGVLAVILMIWVAVAGLAEAARRLHDTGRSGWWSLINLIPYLGFLVWIYLLAQPGKPGDTEYGPAPDATATT